MKLFKKLLLAAITLVGAANSIITSNRVKASASSPESINGVKILFDSSKGSSDYAFLDVPVNGLIGKGYSKKHIVFAFDSYDKNNPITNINRMHFRLHYLQSKNIFNDFGNWFQTTILNNPPKYGEIEEAIETVKASTTYSLKWTNFGSTNVPWAPHGFLEPEKLTIPAIGKIDQLLAAEKAMKQPINADGKTPSFVADNLIVSGYTYKGETTGLNVLDKTLPKREFYAIIPLIAEKGAPESIDCTLLDGTEISDGLNDNGEAFVNESGEKYIDATPSKDFGISINGTNAILKRIEVTGYTTNNDTLITLTNAMNANKNEPVNVKNKRMIASNQNINLNWTITNNNRYVFIEWSGEDAEQIKIRFIYDNTNDSPALLINIQDKDGYFLPDPIIFDPNLPKPKLNFNDLLIILAIIAALLIVLAIAYDFLKSAIFKRR